MDTVKSRMFARNLIAGNTIEYSQYTSEKLLQELLAHKHYVKNIEDLQKFCNTVLGIFKEMGGEIYERLADEMRKKWLERTKTMDPKLELEEL